MILLNFAIIFLKLPNFTILLPFSWILP